MGPEVTADDLEPTPVAGEDPIVGASLTAAAEPFRQLFRRHPAGVTVVTLAAPDGRPAGFTATSVISVAASPPTVALSVATSNRCWPAIADSASLVINFLGSGQAGTARRFATPGIDRFADERWCRLRTGEPVLEACHSWLRGRIVDRIPVGASILVVVEVARIAFQGNGSPLVYHDREHHRLAPCDVAGA